MLNLLQQSFKQYSIIWIIISGIIASIITLSLKFVFEKIFEVHIRERHDAILAYKKYKYIIFKSAEDLLSVLIIYLKKFTNDKYLSSNDDYHIKSVLYSFGCFFALIKIIEEQSFIEMRNLGKKINYFKKFFFNTIASISSNKFLPIFDKTYERAIKSTIVYSKIISAMGELMIIPNEDNKIIGYSDFYNKLNTEDFIHWFNYLSRILIIEKEPKREDKKVNKLTDQYKNNQIRKYRLTTLAVNLKILLFYIDDSKFYKEKKDENFMNYIDDENVKNLISKEIGDIKFLRKRIAKSSLKNILLIK